MKPLTPEELQQILDATGLTKNAVEKQFGMGQGSIGKFLKGSLKSLPDKYVAKIRKLGNDAEKPAAKIHLDEKEVPFIEEPLEKKLEGLIPEVKHLDERPIPEKYQNKIEDVNNLPNLDIKELDKMPIDFNDPLFIEKGVVEMKPGLLVPKESVTEIKRPLINKDLLP
jgi:hypothetical protein